MSHIASILSIFTCELFCYSFLIAKQRHTIPNEKCPCLENKHIKYKCIRKYDFYFCSLLHFSPFSNGVIACLECEHFQRDHEAVAGVAVLVSSRRNRDIVALCIYF